MISIIQNGDIYEIRFRYDPQLVAIIKSVPGKRWNPDNKYWTLPKDRLGFFINALKGTKFEGAVSIQSNEHLNENASIDSTTIIPNIDISKIKFYAPSESTPFNHQLDFMKYAIDKQRRGYKSGFIVGDDMGLGKALTLDTPIFTPDGYKLMQDICVGDSVFNEQGEPVTVLRTYYHDCLDMYRITFSDGASIVCCKDHLWQVNVFNSTRVMSTSDIVSVIHDGHKCNEFSIPITQPVKFNHKDVSIDPEILGNLLGSAFITESDLHMMESDTDNSIEQTLHPAAHNLFVPDCYKYNDVETREAILRGLACALGSSTADDMLKIYSTSKRLVEDVNWLVLSLGRICKIKNISSSNHDLYCIEFQPCSTYSSKFSYTYNCRKFDSIEYVGRMPGKCITVSGESHLYVADNFIVTHNTLEAINLAIYNKKQYKFKHCLVICNINSSKYNWKKEIESATNQEFTGYILGARIKRDGSIDYDRGSKAKIEDLETGYMYGSKTMGRLPYFLICNVESLRAKQGRKYVFADLLIDYINSGRINMVIIDEIHRNMSPSSTQGKQILRIKKLTGRKCEWIPMTGTPIVKKPTDVFLPMKLIDAHTYNSYYAWCNEFCIFGGFGGHEIIGYKNIPRLKTMLQSNMIRRLKSEVLDLPPKIHLAEYVDNTAYQQKLYESIRLATLADAENILSLLNPMVKLLKLRQVNGSPELVDSSLKVDKYYIKHNAKVRRLLEIVEDIHATGEKVIIFSNWVEPLRTLYKLMYGKYKICCFTGTMSDSERENNKITFQTNPEYTVLLGTIGAAGTTHTFTAASNIIFLDEPFNATDKAQAEDRAYRIGTKDSLKIYTLLTRNTVDDRVHEIVYEKAATSKYIVDGIIDFKNNPELFYKLLGK